MFAVLFKWSAFDSKVRGEHLAANIFLWFSTCVLSMLAIFKRCREKSTHMIFIINLLKYKQLNIIESYYPK